MARSRFSAIIHIVYPVPSVAAEALGLKFVFIFHKGGLASAKGVLAANTPH